MSSEQLTWFSEPRSRHDSPDTSIAAAAKVKPGHSRRLDQIAQWVDDSGRTGMTADEVYGRACLEDPTQLSRRSTWHGAFSRCADTGRIVPKGYKCSRLSINNTIMRVMVTPRHKGN